MKKYKVRYNANPDALEGMDHLGRVCQMTCQQYKEFDSLPKAIDFYMECTSPLDKLKDLAPNEDWVKEFNEKVLSDGILEAEQYYWENREEIFEEV